MNKLLKFFIPKTTVEIAKFYGIAIAVVASIQIFPISDVSKIGLVLFLLLLIFPLISYFNNVMYLPTSLDWILLTPTKKIHIVLAHGILNIYKVLLTYFLAFLFLYLFKSEVILTPIEAFLTQDAFVTFTRTSVHEFNNWIILIGTSLLFIFGILPNYVQSIQQRQNYQVQKTSVEKAKSFFAVSVLLMMCFFFISEFPESESYFPWLLKMTSIFVFILFGAIYSTLRSLRFYFSKKKFYGAAAISFLVISFFLHFYASRDILSKNLHVIDKIESLNFLGAYSSDLEKEVVNELITSGPSLQLMTLSPLRNFFLGQKRLIHLPSVLGNWEKRCQERRDFSCRLTHYIHTLTPGKNNSLELLVQGCPIDIGSCFLIYAHKEASMNDRKMALEVLSARCENNKNEFEINFCKRFKSQEKKKN